MQNTNLHTFFVYVFFGYFLIFPAVLLCLRIFRIEHPRQRMQLYCLALITPFAGFILYHTLLIKRCQSGVYPTGPGWQVFNALCSIGSEAIRFIGPLLVLMVLLGFAKALAGIWLVSRIRQSAVAPPASAGVVLEVLKRQAAKLGVREPAVIYSQRPGFAAFTAGILRPVIVVNTSVISALNEEELEDVLTHELIHIVRGDGIRGWLLRAARDAMFFSPFSSILLGRYLLENERLCDRETVRVTGRPRRYAATILKVWRVLLEAREFTPGLAAGFTGKRRDLEIRVTSLLTRGENERLLPAQLYTALLATIFAGTIMYLGLIC